MPRRLSRRVSRRGGAPIVIDPWRLIGAHYLISIPLSLFNTAQPDYYDTGYLNPNGEGGKHTAYGGFWRDRPAFRGPRPLAGTSSTPAQGVAGQDFSTLDFAYECVQAQSVGIDMFWVDVVSIAAASDNYKRLSWMAQACVNTNFKMVPMLDGSGGLATVSSSDMANAMMPVFQVGGIKSIGGRPLISSFRGEAWSVSWWTDVLNRLEAGLGVRPRLILQFLNASQANMNTYASIVDGFGVWGNRRPETVAAQPNYAAMARALGKKWCSPVSNWDFRPKNSIYAEAKNLTTYREMWDRARSDGSDMIQLVTWNDMSECTAFQPTLRNEDSFFKILPYQMAWWRVGTPPEIAVDRLAITNRPHFSNAIATNQTTQVTGTLDGTSTPVNNIEVEVYAVAPCQVSINGGAPTTCPKGRTVITTPLVLGTPQAVMTRDGINVAMVVSNTPVVDPPSVYDFAYYATAS